MPLMAPGAAVLHSLAGYLPSQSVTCFVGKMASRPA